MGIIIRQSIKGTIFTYIGALIGFLTTFYIVPKYIGEELYGLSRVILEAGILFSVIFQLGASSSIIRFFPYFKSKRKSNNGFFFYLISLVSIGFLLFIPIFFLLKQPIINYFSAQSPLFIDYLYWIIPLTFFFIYWTTFETYSNALMRIAIPKFIREILIRLLFLIVYIAYAAGYLNLTGFVTAFVGVFGVAMLATFFYIAKIGSVSLKHNSSFITPELKKDFFSYSSIIVLGTVGGSLLSRMDLFMISGEIGLASAGIYAIAFNIISVIEMPARSITPISAPIAAEALKSKNFAEASSLYKKVSSHQLLIGGSIFLLIWVNINNIYEIIPNGNIYQEGKMVVLFMGIAKIIEMTIGFGSILINFSRYYHWSLYFTFFITGLNLLLNWLLIPRFGISGAALATASASLISYSLQQWLVLVKIKANPYSINTLKIILMFFISLGINKLLPVLENAWYDTMYRTIIISLIIVILTYVLRVSEDIRNIINKIFSKFKLSK